MKIDKAISLLRTHYVWVDNQDRWAKHITKDNADGIATLLEKQQRLITAIGSVIAAQDCHDTPAEVEAMVMVREIYKEVVGE